MLPPAGYSLRQPHLERTRLCELTDDQLDHKYVQQRDALKQLVHTLARPKVRTVLVLLASCQGLRLIW